ncbi:universal stress protein [Nocardioides sp. NPDC059952]|uniref:universal stress protein n=1 Tax=Nocardioides sp. NPDC059952 TaxID=3347014 RepID=UPI00365E7C8E
MAEHDRILVGIDGGEGGRAAIRHAAERAGRSGAHLWLVHVIDLAIATGVFYPYGYAGLADQIREAGTTALEHAEKEAAEIVGSENVTSTLRDGGVVTELVHAAADSTMVVLGDERHHGLSRIVTGSVTGRVASRAPVPVVIVPAVWPHGQDARTVVVAVADCDASTELVVRALAEAVERGGGLVIVHAWEVPAIYYESTLGKLDAAGLAADARHQLMQTLERARQLVPNSAGVDAWIEVHRGQPAQVVMETAKKAALLVIGRRGHAFPLRRLGGTGHALLRESGCPVEVVPPVAEAP